MKKSNTEKLPLWDENHGVPTDRGKTLLNILDSLCEKNWICCSYDSGEIILTKNGDILVKSTDHNTLRTIKNSFNNDSKKPEREIKFKKHIRSIIHDIRFVPVPSTNDLWFFIATIAIFTI
jgi:hypothetical protein